MPHLKTKNSNTHALKQTLENYVINYVLFRQCLKIETKTEAIYSARRCSTSSETLVQQQELKSSIESCYKGNNYNNNIVGHVSRNWRNNRGTFYWRRNYKLTQKYHWLYKTCKLLWIEMLPTKNTQAFLGNSSLHFSFPTTWKVVSVTVGWVSSEVLARQHAVRGWFHPLLTGGWRKRLAAGLRGSSRSIDPHLPSITLRIDLVPYCTKTTNRRITHKKKTD
jgi:hypothetical protein